MTEEEFTKRLTDAEKGRLKECSREIAACVRNEAYSFTAFWAGRITEILNDARSRMAREDAQQATTKGATA